MRYIIDGWVIRLGNTLSDMVLREPLVYFDSRRIRFDTWGKILAPDHRKEEFFCDGVHPSELAYRLWASQTMSFIRENQVLDRLR